MLIFFATTPPTPINFHFYPSFSPYFPQTPASLKPNATSTPRPHDLFTINSFTPSSLQNSRNPLPLPPSMSLHFGVTPIPIPWSLDVCHCLLASTSPVDFLQRFENDQKIVLPNLHFQKLCIQQLHLFCQIVNPDALS
ncbi:hypothetical protein ACFX13_029176 [Malus domestica]